MNQIDLLVILILLFGGWLGYVKGSARAFISCSGTILGIGLASLYASRLSIIWNHLFLRIGRQVSLEFPWVATATTQGNWQQTAYQWLEELLWPDRLKTIIADNWTQIQSNSSLLEWGQVVEKAFYQALSNVCAFLTILVLTKLLVSLLAGVSLKLLVLEERSSWVGFATGLLQSALLIILIVALAIPFLVFSEQSTLLRTFSPSITFTLVKSIISKLLIV